MILKSSDAIKEVLVIFQEDRKRYGCIVDMTIANNTVMTNLDSSHIKGGLIDDGEIVKVSDEFVKQVRTKTSSSNN